ncbi:hypothetical protein COTS27_00150 [Spirochaetota bacterium]|nr:hypothetical protein COTS27_00150 [Spirochaetota bacterium]
MKTEPLNHKERIKVASLYVAIFLGLCMYLSGEPLFFLNLKKDYSILFWTATLLLIVGTYITEPYFTKPANVTVNAIGVFIALLGYNYSSKYSSNEFYYPLLFGFGVLIICSILLIYFSKSHIEKNKDKLYYKFYCIVVEIGKPIVIFSILYLFIVIYYIKKNELTLTLLILFWIFFRERCLEKLCRWLEKLCKSCPSKKNIENIELIGEAIGCQNPLLYKVEIDYSKYKYNVGRGDIVLISLKETSIGIVIHEKQLLNKKWITVHLIEKSKSINDALNDNQIYNQLNSHLNNQKKTIYFISNAVYKINIKNEESRDNENEYQKFKGALEEDDLYRNRNNYIGYVVKGSNINEIKIQLLLDDEHNKYKEIKEGTVVKTKIHNKNEDVLYQIVNAQTDEENLEKYHIYGYLTITARKLGYYNETEKELELVPWIPYTYTPVFLLVDAEKSDNNDNSIVGKLPRTSYGIPVKDYNSLVTHNTAILGILGIGKSCLTFELIKKIVERTDDTKIICIDITGEYEKELPKYIDESKIYSYSGNPMEYFEIFINNKPDKKVFIVNPDKYPTNRRLAEETKYISEKILNIIKEKGICENNEARVLLVFEEAHSLIPEWNSTDNKKDQDYVNATAKVILQGRKYGLGSMVITQRTANVSKSILSQCNTIFALRMFDDTGKEFLNNYIGSSYVNALSTLEERHAIVTGKALKLKQPVIIELNDKNDITADMNNTSSDDTDEKDSNNKRDATNKNNSPSYNANETGSDDDEVPF